MRLLQVSLTTLVFVITLNQSIAIAQSVPSSFGEQYNNTVTCDSKALLACLNGTCLCLNITEMFFDISRSECVMLVGKQCISKLGKAFDCVENAVCTYEGYCKCKDEFRENAVGQCVPQKKYGESCKNDGDCQSGLNLICVGGKCLCNETEALYYTNPDQGWTKCVGKVGASCDRYKSCAPNAHCLSYPDRICACDRSYNGSKDGLCLGTYKMPCDPVASPCLDEFSCIGGRCKCLFPNFQDYDDQTSKCISSINGPCLQTIQGKITHFDCTGNTECRSDFGLPECLCKKGYIQSSYGFCKKSFGSSCKSGQECDGVPGSNQICRDGRCSCSDFQIYDERLNQCVGLMGALCGEGNGCVENAFCQMERDTIERKQSGICRCKPGTKVDASRSCVKMVKGEIPIVDRSEIAFMTSGWPTSHDNEI